MYNEAIILAGGLGTRLSSIVKNVPKPMAQINSRPFIDFIFYFLHKNNIDRVVIAVGHKKEIIKEYLNPENTFGIEINYSDEEQLLGTGGAITQALKKIKSEACFVVNGDTYFDINLSKLKHTAQTTSANVAIGLKRLENNHRYGSVSILPDKSINGFIEKDLKCGGSTLINGGIYFIRTDIFDFYKMPKQFSFETDFLQRFCSNINAYGEVFDNTFIDIGVPTDFKYAQELLKDVFI